MEKKTKVIDFHTHLLPKSWPDFSRRYGYLGFIHIDHDQSEVKVAGNARLLRDNETYLEIGPNCWDLEHRIRDMDQNGVEVQVVSTIPEMFSYWAKGDDAADLARILNNDMSEQIKRFPDRFIGLGTIPLQAPELAVAELNRCMKQLGFKGVIIGTHINEWNLDAPELVPFWEAAEELGATIFVHPNNLEVKGETGMNHNLLPKFVGMSAEICHSVSTFLTGALLDKFPKLMVCFAHGAGSFPFVRGQLEYGLEQAKLGESAQSISPSTYIGRFYCDSIVHSPEASKFLLDVMTEDMVVFGSDYPLPLGEFCCGSGNDEGGEKYVVNKQVFDTLAEETREKILGANAVKLLLTTKTDQEQQVKNEEQENDDELDQPKQS